MATKSRVRKTELKAVETEYSICPLCEMEYEPDEMVEIYSEPKISLRNKRELVWLNRPDGREIIHDHLSVEAEDDAELCPTCAENIGLERSAYINGEEHEITISTLPIRLTAHWWLIAGIAVGMVLMGLLMVVVV